MLIELVFQIPQKVIASITNVCISPFTLLDSEAYPCLLSNSNSNDFSLGLCFYLHWSILYTSSVISVHHWRYFVGTGVFKDILLLLSMFTELQSTQFFFSNPIIHVCPCETICNIAARKLQVEMFLSSRSCQWLGFRTYMY